MLPEEKNKVEELMNYLVLHKDTVFTQQEQVSITFIYTGSGWLNELGSWIT